MKNRLLGIIFLSFLALECGARDTRAPRWLNNVGVAELPYPTSRQPTLDDVSQINERISSFARSIGINDEVLIVVVPLSTSVRVLFIHEDRFSDIDPKKRREILDFIVLRLVKGPDSPSAVDVQSATQPARDGGQNKRGAAPRKVSVSASVSPIKI